MAPSLDSSDHQDYETCLGLGIPINLDFPLLQGWGHIQGIQQKEQSFLFFCGLEKNKNVCNICSIGIKNPSSDGFHVRLSLKTNYHVVVFLPLLWLLLLWGSSWSPGVITVSVAYIMYAIYGEPNAPINN